ncbi:MAG: DUF4352 domain-containing protein [Eggerthellaceae bacterium]|nr:DUF4352 domain-containing protein [Eggerthellaceae bacterium]
MSKNAGTSAMAILSLILGVLAMVAAIVPLFVPVASMIGGGNVTAQLVVNNSAFVFAIIGLIFALIGTHGIQAGKKTGRGIAVAGVLLCVLSVVAVLLTQYLFPGMFNNGANKANASTTPTTTATAPASSSAASASAADYSAMAVGDTVVLDNGLAVTVNSATFDLKNFDGSNVTAVNVTYENKGKSNRSFNVYDWKALDTTGALRSETYYSEADKELQSGDLTPGGTVTGNIYFDGNATKVYYYDNIVQSESNIGWVLQ